MSEVPFRAVCDFTDVPDGKGFTVELDGEELTIFRRGSDLWCSEGRCPHAFEAMSKAVMEGETVECLAHHYCFELKSGKAIRPTPGAAFLKMFPVKIEDGKVFVAFEGEADEW